MDDVAVTDSLFWGPRSDEVEIESHYGLVFLHPSVCVLGGGGKPLEIERATCSVI